MTEDRNGVPADAGEEVWVDRDWPRLVVGGLYMILGIVYMWLGLTWIVTPTQTRLAGIEWAGLAAHFIGAWWIAGGAATFAAGFFNGNTRLVGFGAATAVLTPLFVSGLFAWSVLMGNERGFITAGSYLPYGVVAAFVTWSIGRLHLDALRREREQTTHSNNTEGTYGE